MLSQILGTSTITETTPCDPEKVLSSDDSEPEHPTVTDTLDGAPGSGDSTPKNDKDEFQQVDQKDAIQCQGSRDDGTVTSYFRNLFQSCKDVLEDVGTSESQTRCNQKLSESIELPLDLLLNKMTVGFNYSNVEYPGVDTDIDDVRENLMESDYYGDKSCPSITCDSDQFTTLMERIVCTDEDDDDDSDVEDQGSTLIHVVMHNDEPVSFHATERDAINAMWEWARRELIRDLEDTCCHINVGTDPTQLGIQARGRFSWLPIYREIHSFYVTPVRGYLD